MEDVTVRSRSSLASLAAVAAIVLAGCGGGHGPTSSALPADGTRTAQTVLIGGGGQPNTMPGGCGCSCDLSTLSTSNFDGTRIVAGNAIWFNAVAKFKGVKPGDEVNFESQQVTIGGSAPISLPDVVLNFTSSGAATASFDDTAFTWHATPSATDKNVFVGGYLYRVQSDIPGGQNPVIWSGHFHVPHGVSVQWQWAAAVYGGVDQYELGNSPGMNGLDVLAYDGANGGEHAGTPDAMRADLVGGARGGKGSNFTGSYSGTFSVYCPLPRHK